MSVELWCLFAAMVLGLVHLTVASFTFKAQVGNRYSVGPRDENLQPTGVAGRLARAQRNFLETFPIFAAAVLMAHGLGREATWSTVGSLAYVAGRVMFLPLYALGTPWLRTFSWNLATAGLALLMASVALEL